MILLPANELISAGIRDLNDRKETVAALLVSVGAPKLRSLGMDIPEVPVPFGSTPEHRLYNLLSAEGADSAHSRYNALIRRLVSFERAYPCVKK